MNQTVTLDDDVMAFLLEQAQEGQDINTLANTAIRAAHKMFRDLGLKYVQEDTSPAPDERERTR